MSVCECVIYHSISNSLARLLLFPIIFVIVVGLFFFSMQGPCHFSLLYFSTHILFPITQPKNGQHLKSTMQNVFSWGTIIM